MVVVVAVPLAYVLVLYCLARSRPPRNSQRSFFLYCCHMCLRFRGCPVLPHIELSVSARYHKTHALLRARRLLLDASASGGVRHNNQNYMRSSVQQHNDFGPIRTQEDKFKTHYFREIH